MPNWFRVGLFFLSIFFGVMGAFGTAFGWIPISESKDYESRQKALARYILLVLLFVVCVFMCCYTAPHGE